MPFVRRTPDYTNIVTAKNMFPLKATIKYGFHRSDDKGGGYALSWKAIFSAISKEARCLSVDQEGGAFRALAVF